jgi:SAM-dependent methyltransferase
MPGGLDIPVLKDLDIIGAGYREYDYCPVCKASYRQRLIKIYLDKSNLLKSKPKILHIAPEECLYHLFRKNSQKYICGDLFPELYSYYSNPIKIDLTELNFQDNSFDLISCNHVLEHIPNDIKAMNEIYRTLVPGGKAFVQVPISHKLSETHEDFSITTEKERLEAFGQRDHVRVYAKDYKDKLENIGFNVEAFSIEPESIRDFEKLSLEPREVLYIAKKSI